MLNINFVFLGAALNLIGSTSYVIDTLKGKTQPNRITWLLWALAPLIAFFAELGQGIGLRSLMTFMVGFGPLMVFTASLINRKAYWHISRLDYVCGALSLLALVLWALTKSSSVAIIFSILSDALAALPTVIKSYREPESENYSVFLFGAISASITLLTINRWSFANYGFPGYILLICLVLFVLIRFKIGNKIHKLIRQ
jgi:hypothetical protein